jgi:acetyl-CoA carboxylase carboxyltransferase component
MGRVSKGAGKMEDRDKVAEFRERVAKLKLGGGEKAAAKQTASGKLIARDRILALLDEGSFHEYDLFVEHECRDFGMAEKALPGDGVITGTGTIEGFPVCIYAQDFTVAGGSLGLRHARKITKIMDHAMNLRVPLIGINDSGGARIQEGVNSLAGYGEIFYRNTLASGVIPQISIILGPCAGGAVYSPALTDFVFVVDKISKMFITGPEVIKTVLNEDISMEDLGGARVQSEISGNAHFFAESEHECFEQVKRLVTFIPWNNAKRADPFPTKATSGDVEQIVPHEARLPFDVRDLIRALSDGSDFFEVHEHFAANIVVGFARLNGHTVGMIGNQPLVLAGTLDVDAADKAARFIRFCDAFNIPLVTLVDTPGYLPGVDQEHMGVIRHGAKILYAYSEATVPKITVILRKAYGGAYIAMCSRHLGADFVFAWPTAEVAVMGSEGAANIIFRKEIAAADDPEETRQRKIREYGDKFANPYIAAASGHIDGVIDPVKTRDALIHALEVSREKQAVRPERKHGIPPF